MRIRFVLIFALTCSFFAFAEGRNRCLAAHLVAPENQLEINLSYPALQNYQLSNKDGSTASNFDVYIDRNRTGHLQSRQTKDLVRYLKEGSSFKKDWVDRTSFKSENGWTQLTFSHAKQFWGEPRKHLVNGHEFYTFDAQSDWNGEANIYHLDLEFVMCNQIKAYRIRGIGIQNPKWINEDSVEAVLKTGEGASKRLRVEPIASPGCRSQP